MGYMAGPAPTTGAAVPAQAPGEQRVRYPDDGRPEHDHGGPHQAGLPPLGSYVFVDAGLPTPGQAWMETVPPELAAQLREMADADGWLPPWSRWWGDEAMSELLPDPETRRWFAAGCPRLPLELISHHLAPLTDPGPVAASLRELIGRL